jgi:hypothetical protein
MALRRREGVRDEDEERFLYLSFIQCVHKYRREENDNALWERN